MLVIIFGLFHGVVFLPVILSIIGPQPYVISKRRSTNDTTATISEHRKYNGNGDIDNINEMTNLQSQNGTERK